MSEPKILPCLEMPVIGQSSDVSLDGNGNYIWKSGNTTFRLDIDRRQWVEQIATSLASALLPESHIHAGLAKNWPAKK